MDNVEEMDKFLDPSLICCVFKARIERHPSGEPYQREVLTVSTEHHPGPKEQHSSILTLRGTLAHGVHVCRTT